MKIMRRLSLIVTFCLVLVMAAMPAVKAATYTAGELSLSITDGQAMLTVANDSSVAPIQLTKKLVTKDGAIDPSTGTVYLRWMSNSLYAYNYTLQKGEAKVNLILVDTGVTSLEISSSDVSVITGYYTAAGKKSLLTMSEIKSKLGISEETEEEKQKREAEEAAKKKAEEEAAKKAAEEAARKKAEEEAAKKAAEEAAKKKAEEEAKKKAAEEAAQKAAEEAAKKQQQTTQQQSQQTNTQQQQSNSTVAKDGVSVVKTESGKAAYVVTKSGKTVKYVMPLKNVDRYGIDKNGTLWLKGQKGCLYLWNYELQSSASTIKMVRVTSQKCTGLAFDSKGKVTGYYVAGSLIKKAVWSKSKIKKALSGKKEATKNKKTKEKTSKKYMVVAKNNGARKLMTTDGKKKDSFRFKNNSVIYHGVIYRNVRTAAFNEKGTLLLLAKDDSLIAVNRSSFKLSKKATNVSHFNYTKWGTVKYAVYKTGTRFKVSKY